MNKSLRNKVLAIIITIVIIFGWFITLAGIPGAMDPLKDKINLGLDIKGGVYVVLEAQDTDQYSESELKDLMDQTKEVIENRVDQMGLANPTVSVEGTKRIRVELPGVENATEAVQQIGKTAQLKFTLADQSFVLDGSDVEDATSSIATQTGETGYQVNLEFSTEGAKAFEQATKTALKKSVKATVPASLCQDGAEPESDQILIWLDNTVISHPTVNEVISGGKCDISGNFSQEGASTLAALIRGGSLPLTLEEIQSSSQTAQIGEDAFDKSVIAGIIGMILIFIIMIVFFRAMGLVADLALLLYVFLILGGMALTGSVLTLPGIAGLILSIGMAVDANVIIFVRIKEEIAAGKSIRVATNSGYRRALTTVIDAQVTTLIAAVVLYQLGTSAVKGFAWTLMVGTVCSILTAALITQVYLNIMAESKFWAKLKFFAMHEDGTPMFEIKKFFNFIKNRKIYYTVSIVVLVVGIAFFAIRGFNYGIDFTGGTMLHLDTGTKVSQEDLTKVLEKHEINTAHSQIVFTGEEENEVIIKTQETMTNDQRDAIVKDVKSSLGVKSVKILESEFFGASVGKELRNNALKALAIAALCMLIYIRLRFKKWKFGAAALIGVLHDALILMAFYAIFGITVNNPFIAAILTVVGYSINDTIVIFDRVRENNLFMKSNTRIEVLDASINQTLSRSVLTSVTTLVVMIPLTIMTSDAITEFTIPLMIGVATGCLSSIFICSPLYYEFEKIDEKHRLSNAQKTRKPSYAIQHNISEEDLAARNAKKAEKEEREKERKNK